MEDRKDYLLTLIVNAKTRHIIIGASVLLILIVIFGLWNMNRTVFINNDTTINNNLTITSNKEVVLKNGATLNVIGDMIIDGTLSCDGGTLSLQVRDSLTVNGKINCSLPDSGNGIAVAISAKHISFSKTAELNTNGHIEIVNDAAKLLSSEDAVARIYRETEESTGNLPRVGPLIEQEEGQAISMGTEGAPFQNRSPRAERGSVSANSLIKTAGASELTDNTASMILGGTWLIDDKQLLPSGLSIPTPPKNTKDILVLLDVGEEGVITLQDLHITGPNGKDGDDDIAKNCNALGKDGANAFHVRVNAGNIDLNNVQLELGAGGRGGNAETTKDCSDAVAQGGAGGEAGNFKMTAAGGIHITNFMIIPGRGGNGGNATAIGRSGENSCPGGNGGNATATGGEGRKNKKDLATAGNITGLDNIKTGRIVGGSGGDALAIPGKGGNGTLCGCAGGKGGNGITLGGNGGDAWVGVPVGTTEGHGGDGGSADTHGAVGGNGGSCSVKQNGGMGGVGGDAQVTAGKSGKGLTANGNNGVIKNQGGGDGGAGGDGCNPGIGGQGGIGAPLGTSGSLGKNTCADDMPQQNPPPATSPTLIQAILYKGKYLPVDQLIILNEAGCGAEHWHAAQGSVTATDDSEIPDPDTLCGFGKQVENQPVMVPKSVEHGTLIQLPNDPGL